MKQIPFDESGSVYDRALSRPIDFGIFRDRGEAEFYDTGLRSIPKMFQLSTWELARWSWLMLKTWSAHDRTHRRYSRLNAARAWGAMLSERSKKIWRSSFGPWIGSDWTKASLHHAGQFFRKQLLGRSVHPHPPDDEGPAWLHRTGDGWLLLRGPSSEVWFDKWVGHLEKSGVTFFWKDPLAAFDTNGNAISSAHLESKRRVEADYYILATGPFAAADIIGRSPRLEQMDELRCFKPLVQDGPHSQVSFRIAFSEPIAFPRKRTAVVVADSEFNITLFAEEQVWWPKVALGKNVKSLWTATTCVGTVPGRIYKLPVIRCTKEQFVEEVKAQILSCESLDSLVKEANCGRSLKDFEIEKIEVWHEWEFSPDGLKTPNPKWVTTTNTHPHIPGQRTPLSNLVLAGAHTRTAAEVWSIEGAVESGRRAAQVIDPRVDVLPEYKPRWLRAIASVDDLCFKVGAPHVLDVLLVSSLGALVALGDARAVKPLIELAHHKPPEFVIQIVYALASLKGPAAEGYLVTLASGHPVEAVRAAAEEALQELTRRSRL